MDPDSLVSNIEDTILRTRQIMQESKAITIKNQQRKNMLEEKFSFNDIKIEKDPFLNTSEIIRRVSEIEIRASQDSPLRNNEETQKIEELQKEVYELHKKIKSQAMKIELLENKLSEINLEKISLLQELKIVKKDHEIEISDMNQKLKDSEARPKTENFDEIEERIVSLEEKYKNQVMANHQLIEEIQKLQKQDYAMNPSKKITELEDLLMSSLKKYKGLKDRLEKTENLITFDKSTFSSPKSVTSKKSKMNSPKTFQKKTTKNRISSYKSTTKLS